jgi:peptidoglycan/LPS O-acetylase OafA/YrhL
MSNENALAQPSLTSAAVEPASGALLRTRMPELDTLRGIAVLLVLFFHGFGFEFGLQGLHGIPKLLVAATLPGWVGVNLFFVLSGFLITGILLDTKARPDYFRRFYYRRALRILPIYYAVLIALAVFSRAGLISRPASWGFLGLSAIYLANVTELFGVPMQYGVLWTLAIEEHFYLIWPTAVRALSRKMVAVAALAIFIGCALLRYYYCLKGYDAGQGYTWLYADGLALGAILAAIARSS